MLEYNLSRMKFDRNYIFLFLFLISCDGIFVNEQPQPRLLELISDDVDQKMRKADLTIRVKIHDEIPASVNDYSFSSVILISEESIPTEENRAGFDQVEEIGLVHLDEETSDGISWRSIVALEPSTTYYYEHIFYYDNLLDDIERQSVSTGIKSFTTKEEVLEYGGIVFYDKGETTNGWRYLVSADKNWFKKTNLVEPMLPWGCDSTYVENLEDGLGEGLINTRTIVDQNCASNGVADFLVDLELNGYNDWYLGSPAEVKLLFKNADVAFCCYSMTSTNLNAQEIRIEHVENHASSQGLKTEDWLFRPIRRE